MTEPSDRTTTVADLRRIVHQFVDERNWGHFHNPKNLSTALTIEAGELMEHFQWLTTEQVTDHAAYDRRLVAEELADVVCYALAIANALDLDISSSVEEKMVKNRTKYPVDGA